MGNDEWEYHHTTDSGYRVNEDGYDQNGIGHKYDVRPSSSGNTTSSSSSSDAGFESRFMAVTAKLLVLGLVVLALYKINQYFIKNWTTVVTVLGGFIICAIACFFIIHKSVKKPGLKIFLAILASIGIIWAMLYFDPANVGRIVDNPDSYNPKKLSAIQGKKTKMYGDVTGDVLYIRVGPSVTADVIGQFSKDDHIEITKNLNSGWLEVKFEDRGGYVESVYVKLKKK